jgi:hypothetical protein
VSTGLDVPWLAHLCVLVKAGTAGWLKEASSQLSVVGSQIAGLSGGESAHENFLTIRKDADSDIPILEQAKAEYAKLR